MMREAFKEWLISNNYSGKSVTNYLAQCKWVDDNCATLDVAFDENKIDELLDKLAFRSRETAAINPLCARIGGDCKSNLSTYRSSVKLYAKFRQGVSMALTNQSGANILTLRSRAIPSTPASDWPKWDLPNDEEQLRLASIAVPYIRFLQPEIVRAVVEDNEIHRERWTVALAKRGIDPSLYLWNGSSCAFPGIRRHAGKIEIAQFQNRTKGANPLNALDLDDNAYPKAIWSFVFRGKPFQKAGPDGYDLAHLADHKTYKNRTSSEFLSAKTVAVDRAFFGLFSSVSNTAYIPRTLIRPTDFSMGLRRLLQRRANELYGSFCQLMPPEFTLRPSGPESWSLDAFRWAAPVGTMDHVAAFLAYRNQTLERMLAAKQ